MTHVNCTTCGQYVITESLLASKFPLPDSERYRFSFWCKRRQLEGGEPVPLSGLTINSVVAQVPNHSTQEKANVLLVSLGLLHPDPGKYFRIDGFREYSLACVRNDTELSYFQKCLIVRGDLQSQAPGLQITGQGWDQIGKLAAQGGPTSNTAFVAMWFDDEMLKLWDSVFQPTIKRAGFEPRLANYPAHNEQIDARIMTEIKQSRFVVADVTGSRTGVYFEAGYALGLGRPVIWTCRKDSKKDMHFDTRQYNHILWKDAEDLAKELYYRIIATI